MCTSTGFEDVPGGVDCHQTRTDAIASTKRTENTQPLHPNRDRFLREWREWRVRRGGAESATGRSLGMARLQIALQDYSRGNGIDDLLAVARMSIRRGEALIGLERR